MELNFIFLCSILGVNVSTFNALVYRNVLQSLEVMLVAHIFHILTSCIAVTVTFWSVLERRRDKRNRR